MESRGHGLPRSRYRTERSSRPPVGQRPAPAPAARPYPELAIDQNSSVAQFEQANRPSSAPFSATLRKQLLLVLVGLGAIVLGGIIWQLQAPPNNKLFSARDAAKAGFNLYYPAALPKGLSVRPESAIIGDPVVTFNIYNKSGNPLPVTEQARPAGFDFAKFYKHNFQVNQQFTTPVGEAAVGKLQGINVCSLVTTTTWIMISAQDAAGTNHLPALCKAFKPLN